MNNKNVPTLDLSFLETCYLESHKIHHVDWNKFYDYMKDNNLDFRPGGLEWDQVLENWLAKVGNDFGHSYKLYESNNFFLLSGESEKISKLILNSSEKSLVCIKGVLSEFLEEEKWRIVLILFNDVKHFFDYLEYYSSKSSFPTAAFGFFINIAGYQHIVLRPSTTLDVERAIAHELTHYILFPFQLPLWLDEGLAVTVEKQMYGNDRFMTAEDFRNHKSLWTKKNIEKFLNGQAFIELDLMLTYELAEILVAKILQCEKENVVNLIKNISWEDDSVSSFQKYIGIDIRELIDSFLKQEVLF